MLMISFLKKRYLYKEKNIIFQEIFILFLNFFKTMKKEAEFSLF